MDVINAQKELSLLVDKVHREGVSIDLERDDQIVARLTPAVPRSSLTIGGLRAFIARLPSLEGDAESFAADVRTIRQFFPAENNPWD